MSDTTPNGDAENESRTEAIELALERWESALEEAPDDEQWVVELSCLDLRRESEREMARTDVHQEAPEELEQELLEAIGHVEFVQTGEWPEQVFPRTRVLVQDAWVRMRVDDLSAGEAVDEAAEGQGYDLDRHDRNGAIHLVRGIEATKEPEPVEGCDECGGMHPESLHGGNGREWESTSADIDADELVAELEAMGEDE